MPRPVPTDPPTGPMPVPSLPPASAPAGSLPPGSAPAAGVRRAVGPRVPEGRPRGSRAKRRRAGSTPVGPDAPDASTAPDDVDTPAHHSVDTPAHHPDSPSAISTPGPEGASARTVLPSSPAPDDGPGRPSASRRATPGRAKRAAPTGRAVRATERKTAAKGEPRTASTTGPWPSPSDPAAAPTTDPRLRPAADTAGSAHTSARAALAATAAAAAAAAAQVTDADRGSTDDPNATAALPTPRASRPPRRQPLLVQGAGPAALAVALALASAVGAAPFVLGILAVQVVLVLGVLALVDAPASGGAFVVAAGSLAAADAVVVLDDGQIRGLAGVVALAFVAALLHQLTRTGRSRVTESMADTLVVVTLAVSTSCLLALRALDGGPETVRVALVAAGACLLAGRVGDRLAARPMLAVGSTRGWPGLLLGLGAGVAAAVFVAGDGPLMAGSQAALLGLVCAATVAAADLAVDLGAAELRAGRRDARRVAALQPSGLMLPFALLGPISLVAGHLVLG